MIDRYRYSDSDSSNRVQWCVNVCACMWKFIVFFHWHTLSRQIKHRICIKFYLFVSQKMCKCEYECECVCVYQTLRIKSKFMENYAIEWGEIILCTHIFSKNLVDSKRNNQKTNRNYSKWSRETYTVGTEGSFVI